MIRITSTLLIALLSTSAVAITEPQFESVRALGTLNGIALNCSYIDETRRMKRSLVASVPKLRVIGQAFDESTNSAFLKMISEQSTCPTERSLGEQVDQAIEALEHAFTASPATLLPKP